ncbi:hypothetical protein K1719_026313 [Acacia pycnantha]|nr:hypothetical protein K1719_026313 [Acacia pycnantha]
MEMECVFEFPHTHLDRRPKKRPRLGWDVAEPPKLEKLVSKESLHYDIICFHYYVQYHLHLQLSEDAKYARNMGVVLKGDLPIGVDKNSVDTWVYPNLFRMNT